MDKLRAFLAENPPTKITITFDEITVGNGDELIIEQNITAEKSLEIHSAKIRRADGMIEAIKFNIAVDSGAIF